MCECVYVCVVCMCECECEYMCVCKQCRDVILITSSLRPMCYPLLKTF